MNDLTKLRQLARECRDLVFKYTRAPGENGDRVADLLSEDAYRIGSELLAELDDPDTRDVVTIERSRRGAAYRWVLRTTHGALLARGAWETPVMARSAARNIFANHPDIRFDLDGES